MTAVPFRVTIHGGFAEAEGILRIDGDQLRIDFEVKDAIAGLLKSSHRTVIPLADIDDVIYEDGWLGGRLILRVLELDPVEQMPFRSGAEVTVKIKRRDRDIATDFVDEFIWTDPLQGQSSPESENE